MPKYNKYIDFTEADFLIDEFFQKWVFRPEKETNLFWSAFIYDNPEKAGEVSRAKIVLESFDFIEDFPAEENVKKCLDATLAKIDKGNELKPKAIVKSFNLKWWAAAASVIMLLSVGYFFFRNQPAQQLSKVFQPSPGVNDVAPGGNKALLTLGNGQTIILDSTGNGTISTQGNSTVIKLADGQLAYEGLNEATGNEVVYNTISTPRGGQYNLTLSDGSRVWLNSESSLRFPANFSGDDRKVELTGEGYFEIAHDAKKPFKVAVNKVEVEVLGTHFNINSYADENTLRTTLLQGSVKVTRETQSLVIKPGQQAVLKKSNGNITINQQVNVEEIIAWKNGLFQFENTDIESVMKQIGRWYDLEVIFKGSAPDKKITGKIYRNVNVSKVLRIMEALKIEFKIEGKTVTVTE